jgi:hypothetical protein
MFKNIMKLKKIQETNFSVRNPDGSLAYVSSIGQYMGELDNAIEPDYGDSDYKNTKAYYHPLNKATGTGGDVDVDSLAYVLGKKDPLVVRAMKRKTGTPIRGAVTGTNRERMKTLYNMLPDDNIEDKDIIQAKPVTKIDPALFQGVEDKIAGKAIEDPKSVMDTNPGDYFGKPEKQDYNKVWDILLAQQKSQGKVPNIEQKPQLSELTQNVKRSREIEAQLWDLEQKKLSGQISQEETALGQQLANEYKTIGQYLAGRGLPKASYQSYKKSRVQESYGAERLVYRMLGLCERHLDPRQFASEKKRLQDLFDKGMLTGDEDTIALHNMMQGLHGKYNRPVNDFKNWSLGMERKYAPSDGMSQVEIPTNDAVAQLPVSKLPEQPTEVKPSNPVQPTPAGAPGPVSGTAKDLGSVKQQQSISKLTPSTVSAPTATAASPTFDVTNHWKKDYMKAHGGGLGMGEPPTKDDPTNAATQQYRQSLGKTLRDWKGTAPQIGYRPDVGGGRQSNYAGDVEFARRMANMKWEYYKKWERILSNNRKIEILEEVKYYAKGGGIDESMGSLISTAENLLGMLRVVNTSDSRDLIQLHKDTHNPPPAKMFGEEEEEKGTILDVDDEGNPIYSYTKERTGIKDYNEEDENPNQDRNFIPKEQLKELRKALGMRKDFKYLTKKRLSSAQDALGKLRRQQDGEEEHRLSNVSVSSS